MMVRTPLPSSPSSQASAESNSTSELAFDRFPSLSLSRWMWNPLRVPSGRHLGRRKHDRPPGACARTRNASHIGAEQNHLWPVISYAPPPAGSARVVLARTSEPPCFSVMAIPHSAPAFSHAGTNRRSYVLDRNLGSHSAASSGLARSAGIAAYVIEMGHPNPPSAWVRVKNAAARATWAPGFGSRHGPAWRSN